MSDLPHKMRAITFDTPGDPDVMTAAEIEVPEARPGEVLVKVSHAGVNRPDVVQRRGLYPPPPGASPILGLEVSGSIAALGEGVTRWLPGQKVCALVPGGWPRKRAVVPLDAALDLVSMESSAQAASSSSSSVSTGIELSSARV